LLTEQLTSKTRSRKLQHKYEVWIHFLLLLLLLLLRQWLALLAWYATTLIIMS